MSGELLKRIVRSYLHRDEREFLTAVRQLISSERRRGHLRLADELSKAIANGGASFSSTAKSDAVSYRAPSNLREGAALIDVKHPTSKFDEIILTEETKYQIKRFIQEYVKRDELATFGLKPILKLLFFGPPGNGKTFCAEIIASELGLPLFYVRFDSLVASYLGETAANLRKVFDFATTHKGILLLDEFDAIGKSRDDKEEVGELKRVVNSFLQLLDNYSGTSPIIAATNYEKVLDYALWRRFDSLIYFPQASLSQIEQYLQLRLSSIPSADLSLDAATQLCAGLSYADISRAFTGAVKAMVLSGKRRLTCDMFKDEVEHLRTAQAHRLLRTERLGSDKQHA